MKAEKLHKTIWPVALLNYKGRFTERLAMAKIAIIYCKKIKDHSCIACAKCFKGIAEKNGEFARHDEIELVAMTDCGDCPGLVVPRVKLLSDVLPTMERQIDCIHLGSCVKSARLTAQCPIDLDKMKTTLENKFRVQVVVGTHSY
jgi:predicted metal-binding protein